jgi:hypothetical protein
MSHPVKTLERLLAENGFREISGRRESRIFRSERLDQVFVMSRVRCDDRWARSTIVELLRAIKAPPRSIIKAQEDFEVAEVARIGLSAQPKAAPGQKRSDVKTKGVGYRYFHPDDELSAEEKEEKKKKRAEELALQAVQRDQQRADEAHVREILKPWSEIIRRIKEVRVLSVDPLSLKFLHTELARFWGVTIVGDELHYTKSAEQTLIRINGLWRPDHSGAAEKQFDTGHSNVISYGVKWDFINGATTTIEETRGSDGKYERGIRQDDTKLTFDLRHEANGNEVVCGTQYPDGRMDGAKIFQPNYGTFYGSECDANDVWTVDRAEFTDGTVKKHGRTTDRGRTWAWEGEPAPKKPAPSATTEIAATNLSVSIPTLARVLGRG